MKVLMIEDDLGLVDALGKMLSSYGFEVTCCSEGYEALVMSRKMKFDVILLDLSLPEMDGLDWLQNLRDESSKVPVLIMTARSTVEDKVKGFNTGADDYLAKPFDIDELVVRLKSLIRRSTGVEQFRCGNLIFDAMQGICLQNNIPMEISGREFSLLKLLIKRPGQAVAKDELIKSIFGMDSQGGDDALDVLVHRLRKRIQGSGAKLITLRGIGYYLIDQNRI